MNYGKNTVDWDVGDLVLHDADEKNTQMLMRVVEVKREDGLIKTIYVNRKGSKPHYLNRKEVLHDPAIFIDGMKLRLERHDVPTPLKDAAMVLAVVTTELGFGDEKLPGVIERGKKVLDAAMTRNTTDALGDDLDAYSVAVGFSAALGAYARCLGKEEAQMDSLKEQIRKRRFN